MRSGQPAQRPTKTTQLLDFFYPVAQSRHLHTRPLARQLAGRRLVLFRDQQGLARAASAICPHRGADLSDGEVHNGCLACPYHGWRFDGQGRCVHVPAHPDRPAPARSTLRSYSVREQDGLIWVRLSPQEAPAPPPRLPLFGDPAYRAFTIEDDCPGPADWWMANFMDIAHVPFIHRRTFGGQHPNILHSHVERQADQLGFFARHTVRYQYNLLTRLIHGSARTYTEDLHFTVTIPATVHIISHLGAGRRQGIAMLATPLSARRTRVTIVVWRNYLTWLPGASLLGSWFTRAVLAEDARTVARNLRPHPWSTQSSVASDGPNQEVARLLAYWRSRPSAQARPHV